MKTEMPDRKALHEQIVEQIEKLIQDGTFKPGDKLPPERRLAEMFRVSRNSIRLAIKAMGANGLLETRHGSGTFITAGDNRTIAEVLADAFGKGRKELREILEVRKIVEPQIAELAANNSTPGDINLLRSILEEQRLAIEAGEFGNDEDILFHDTLAQIAGNTVLYELTKALREGIVDSRSTGLQSKLRQQVSTDAHEQILNAVARGDAFEAGRAMRDHLNNIETIILATDNQKNQ